ALEIADRGAYDGAVIASVRWQGRSVGALPRTDDRQLARGGRQRGSGPRERFDERHVAGQRNGTRVAHFTDDVEPLAAVLFHRDGHLRVDEIAVGKPTL